MSESDENKGCGCCGESENALRANIDQKGKNAYYYAHNKTPNGPSWDGKIEPRLLDRSSSSMNSSSEVPSSFDYAKSNIKTYAFLDDGNKVKLYVDLPGIGATPEGGEDEIEAINISLDHGTQSLQLKIENYKKDVQFLCFRQLYGKISSAKLKKKQDKIIITLTKEEDDLKEWEKIVAV